MYLTLINLFYQPGWGAIRVINRDEVPYDPRFGNPIYCQLETNFRQVRDCAPQTIAIMGVAQESFLNRKYPMAHVFLQDIGVG